MLVHGIWMTGFEMALLGRRLRRQGLPPYRFAYSSLRSHPDHSAAALARFIQRLPEPTVHLVGHSMGGRVIERLLNQQAGNTLLERIGRVVTLGTPFGGSHVDRVLCRTRLSGLLVGQARAVLLNSVPEWRHTPPLGVIAGDHGLGIGLIMPGMPKPHDGTVALCETAIAGATDRLVVHAAHLPMLASHEVATQTAHFLHHGRFA